MPDIDAYGLLKHFATIPDPRQARGIRHNLADIVCMAVMAVISNANTYPEIHHYADTKQNWLRTFLELPNGIPSIDTFERVFRILKPSVWQSRFLKWTQELLLPDLPEGEDEILAIDT
jgi:hypothetical protein